MCYGETQYDLVYGITQAFSILKRMTSKYFRSRNFLSSSFHACRKFSSLSFQSRTCLFANELLISGNNSNCLPVLMAFWRYFPEKWNFNEWKMVNATWIQYICGILHIWWIGDIIYTLIPRFINTIILIRLSILSTIIKYPAEIIIIF